MIKTIDMQDMRNLSLFEKITRVRTRFCFSYNDTLMFCVEKSEIPMALGDRGSNLKRISDIIKKRVRIIAKPGSIKDARIFIQAIVAPIEFKDLEIKGNEIVLTAGMQSKAALLGRNKRRLVEMQSIVKDFFEVDFRII